MTEAETRLQAQTLRRATSRFQRALRSARDPDGPTPAQLSVLGTLHRQGPLVAGQLANRERLKPQSVTRLIAALAALGLVKRVVDETDRRRFVVAITIEGRDTLSREMRRRDRQLAQLLANLSDAERSTIAAVCSLLERLAKAATDPS